MTKGRRSETAKRPWWKIWWIWAIVGGFVVIGAVGAIVSPDSDTTSASSAAIPTALPSPTANSTTAAPASKSPTATTQGLDDTHALAACNARGKEQYPDGWNPAWISSGSSQLNLDQTAWIMKTTAKVGNDSGAERSVSILCNVSGTNDAPEVFVFDETE